MRYYYKVSQRAGLQGFSRSIQSRFQVYIYEKNHQFLAPQRKEEKKLITWFTSEI